MLTLYVKSHNSRGNLNVHTLHVTLNVRTKDNSAILSRSNQDESPQMFDLLVCRRFNNQISISRHHSTRGFMPDFMAKLVFDDFA